MTRALFYVDSAALSSGRVDIGGAEGHHAADVKRLRVGERVLVGDGAGSIGEAVVVDVQRGKLVVDVAELEREERPQPRFVVAQALAKGGRDEDAVEAMTEVGVDAVIGWQAQRSVARWTDKTLQRWEATARAAAKQSRRAWVPDVDGPMTTAQLVRRLSDSDVAVVLHETASEPLASLRLPDSGEVLLVVGPEGGIADDELTDLAAAGARACRLGPHVLRASTAGVAALSALSAAHRWR